MNKVSELIDLRNRFKYHKPDDVKIETHQNLREEFLDLSIFVHEICPPSRERSLAITKLEEALFWANASVARYEIEE